jgi:hypothetical protein
MTKSKDQLEHERRFSIELRTLLLKYNAEIEAEDHYPGYPECGEDIRMTVNAYATWDDDGNVRTESLDIDLGKSFDGKGSLP